MTEASELTARQHVDGKGGGWRHTAAAMHLILRRRRGGVRRVVRDLHTTGGAGPTEANGAHAVRD